MPVNKRKYVQYIVQSIGATVISDFWLIISTDVSTSAIQLWTFARDVMSMINSTKVPTSVFGQ